MRLVRTVWDACAKKLQWMERLDLRLFVITGVGFILALPVISYGFPFYSDDGVLAALYYTHFAEQLWAGDFYPRWLQDMNGGLGSPVFFYYPPLSYYLTSAFKIFFANDPYGWHQVGVSAALALIASGLCAYLWLRRTLDQNSAFVAALIYMAMPYHLGCDLYYRGAFAEFWTFVWMPLILYFIDGIVGSQKLAVVGLAVSYALLIMTHLLTTLMFSLVPICYALFLASTGQKVKVLGVTLSAMSLGAGLSAIYWLPAMTTQEFIFIEDQKTGEWYYGNWFLLTPWRWLPAGESYFFWVTVAGAGLGGCAFILSCFSSITHVKRKAAFWIVLAMLCVFMMTPFSKFVWRTIPALQMIQFPWRFNAVLSVATAALLALGIFSIKKPYSAPINAMRTIVLLFVISGVYDAAVRAWNSYSAGRAAPFAWNTYPANYIDRGVVNDRNKWLEQHRDHNAFRPRWVASIEEAELESLLQRIGKSGDDVVKVNVVNGTGTAIVNRWEPREIALQIDTSGGALLNVSQFYYPGWTARLTGEPTNLTVQPSKPDGLLSVAVPDGKHQISLQLIQTMPEIAGQLISTVSAIITILLIVWFYIPRRLLRKPA